jgi:bifunctional non-homologous end joining protein LigD
VWLANLAALELHVPQWKVDSDDSPLEPDLLVFDLDPGPPATIVECCDVAQALRTRLEVDGLTAFPKTSGNKGAQLIVPIVATRARRTSAYAKRLADELQGALPDLVLSTMDKRARRGKVFIDWSQNNAAKTTIAPYSLRGIDRPSVSTPLTWDEVADAQTAGDLAFSAADIVGRLREHGDLLAGLTRHRAAVPDGG